MKHWLENKSRQLSEYLRSTDKQLLIFLLLFMNVSLFVKLIGLIFIFVSRRQFSFGFRQGRLPLFYPAMMALAALEYLFYAHRGFNYAFLVLLIITFWGTSFLATHQLRISAEKENAGGARKAIVSFFVLNALVSMIQIALIMIEIRSVNPYTYTGMNFKYYDSTGDHIRGITGDISTVNMVINTFGLFYFMYEGSFLLCALCCLIALSTTSNLGNTILIVFLLAVVFLDPSRLRKSAALCCISFLVLFISRISPSNLKYVNSMAQVILHLKKKPLEKKYEEGNPADRAIIAYIRLKYHSAKSSSYEEDEKVKKLLAEKEIKDQELEHAEDTIYMRKDNQKRDYFSILYNRYYGDTANPDPLFKKKMPGKALAFAETWKYLTSHPAKFIAGAGPGNFSSKLAFKSSNIGVAGKYFPSIAYVAPEFRDGHFKIALRYLTRPISEHSVVNFPNSILNQLAGEYGLTGLVLFMVLYFYFFLKRFRSLTYGRILLPMCCAFLLTDYWFESLSMLVVFELLMYLDMNRHFPEAGKN